MDPVRVTEIIENVFPINDTEVNRVPTKLKQEKCSC